MGDVDAIENFRGHMFSSQALGIGLLSSPTLRQRIDAKTVELFDAVPSMTETLLAGRWPVCGALPCDGLLFYVDTLTTQACRGAFPPCRVDAGTVKEGTSHPSRAGARLVPCAGVGGDCPLAAHLGPNGFLPSAAGPKPSTLGGRFGVEPGQLSGRDTHATHATLAIQQRIVLRLRPICIADARFCKTYGDRALTL